jgi:dTDP-4-amino-4,6-dideoxygalactose transaminase
MIPFNKPFFTGKETDYIEDSVLSGKISGNGKYTQKCHDFFQRRYGFKKVLLTTSCTDALEMAAILINLVPGDEVIVPSYTFVSTALAFVRQGATVVFADSSSINPNICIENIKKLISSKTKAIVPVHYAGVACDMDAIMDIAIKHNLFVIEDAAQAIDSYYTSKDGTIKPLGSIGHFGTFSFHETKNIISGEGGMLSINDSSFIERAEVVWEKGTDRSKFFRGEIDKYGWIDNGSSFLPSDIIAAFLYAQLENLELIQQKRIEIWNYYYEKLSKLNANFTLPFIPEFASNNAHMFYLIFNSLQERTNFINTCKSNEIHSVFHYLSLHKSSYYESNYSDMKNECINSDRFSECLVRLPLYFELSFTQIDDVVNCLHTD